MLAVLITLFAPSTDLPVPEVVEWVPARFHPALVQPVLSAPGLEAPTAPSPSPPGDGPRLPTRRDGRGISNGI